MIILHIIAGLLGLTAGAVALSAVKGGKLHRKSGMIFFYSMIIMAATGTVIAVVRSENISVVAGLLALYLVFTALLAVRRPVQTFDWLDALAMMIGLSAFILGMKFGFDGFNNPDLVKQGQPPAIGFIFGSIAFLGLLGDTRVIISKGIHGSRRIARHLWRMCFAFFIATASFFLGQADEFPEVLRIPVLLAVPAFAPLAFLFYWLWRVRFKGKRRRINSFESQEAD